MPTVSSYGTGFTGGTGWTNPGNIVGSPGSFASLTTTTAGANTITVTGYGLGALIPPNVTINDVTFEVPQYVSGTGANSRWNNPTIRAAISGTPISTLQTLNTSTSTSNINTVTVTDITLSDLNNSGFSVIFTANKNGTNSATQNVDYILVTVEYSGPEIWGVVQV